MKEGRAMFWLDGILDLWLFGLRHWRWHLGWLVPVVAAWLLDMAGVDWGGWPWFLFVVAVVAGCWIWDHRQAGGEDFARMGRRSTRWGSRWRSRSR